MSKLSKKLQDLAEYLLEIRKKGYEFVVYVCKDRGRHYIPEISAVSHGAHGVAVRGVSWQNCNHTQKELRQIEALLVENSPTGAHP